MKTVYWITTSAISIYLLLSAYSYLLNKNTIEGIRALGFPDYFRIQLAILKVAAVIVLLVPFFGSNVKEWAYAGVFLFLLTSIVAHIAHKDNIGLTIINVVLMGILGTAYYFWKK